MKLLTPSKLRNVDFLLGCILFPLLFVSIFDVYYSSPLVTGVDPIPFKVKSPSDLVILVISDGLRADKIFSKNVSTSVKEIIETKGIWGISHTRVPTESRPGHIAVLGGFYEDVSAITKGWQANAVEFDSILNRSCRAWAWGGPDVVPLFRLKNSVSAEVDEEGSSVFNSDYVRIESFKGEILDMQSNNSIAADQWQYLKTHGEKIFTKSHDCGDRQGNFVFLHLNAADQIGHSHKPNSKEYVEVLSYLDYFLKNLTKTVDKTAEKHNTKVTYFLTADHGMTDWGSMHETATPFMAWGAGIDGPIKVDHLTPNEVNELKKYGLPTDSFGVRKRDIHQADICPLMSSLLGASIPVNSVGSIPLSFLKVDSHTMTDIVRVNCLQIIKQLEKRYEDQKQAHYHFMDYDLLTPNMLHDRFVDAVALQDVNDPKAVELFQTLITDALEAMRYYHTYDRTYHGFCVLLSYAMLTLLFACNMVSVPIEMEKFLTSKKSLSLADTFFNCAFFIAFLLNIYQAAVQTTIHFMYQLVPIIVGFRITSQPLTRHQAKQVGRSVILFVGCQNVIQTINGICLIALLECAIFGFHYRIFLSIGCVILSIWTNLSLEFTSHISRLRRILWSVTCLVIAVFPLMPVIGHNKYPILIMFSSVMCPLVHMALIFTGIIPIIQNKFQSDDKFYLHSLIGVNILSCLITGVTLLFPAFNGILVQMFSWSSLLLPIIVYKTIRRTAPYARIMAYIICFSVPLQLMSLFYEIYFYWILVFLLLQWVGMELVVSSKMLNNHEGKSVITLLPLHMYLRRAAYYLFFLVLGFFGTGNIASINSFNPESTHAFTTLIIPSIMGPLMMYKILCPMLVTGLVTSRLTSNASSHRMSTLVSLTLSNVLAMHFFMWLKDSGSWLDIGESISHYVIAMSIGLASLLFSELGTHLVDFSRIDIAVGGLARSKHS